MLESFPRRVAPALLWAAAAAAAAQPAARPRPDPLEPSAAVPRLTYQSSLRDYRPLADQPVGSWKEANDTVTRIGGWRTYAREAQGAPQPSGSPAPAATGEARPAPAGPAASAPAPAPAGGHAGHHKP